MGRILDFGSRRNGMQLLITDIVLLLLLRRMIRMMRALLRVNTIRLTRMIGTMRLTTVTTVARTSVNVIKRNVIIIVIIVILDAFRYAIDHCELRRSRRNDHSIFVVVAALTAQTPVVVTRGTLAA